MTNRTRQVLPRQKYKIIGVTRRVIMKMPGISQTCAGDTIFSLFSCSLTGHDKGIIDKLLNYRLVE